MKNGYENHNFIRDELFQYIIHEYTRLYLIKNGVNGEIKVSDRYNIFTVERRRH